MSREQSLPFLPPDNPLWRPELAVRRNAYRCVRAGWLVKEHPRGVGHEASLLHL